MAVVVSDDTERLLGVGEPRRDRRERGELPGLQQSLHGSAVGVAADNDVLDAECGNGELDGRRLSAAGGTVRRYNVPGVAEDKQVAWLGSSEQVWINAGVRASDKQGFGILALRQLLKQSLERAETLLLKLVNALDQLLHGSPTWSVASVASSGCRAARSTGLPNGR